MKKIGRYEVIEELGRGAMGVVYKASDPTIGRMVAVKVLTLDDKVEEGTLSPRETFLREARAAGRLSHHGIVTIHDALEDESTRSSYIVMEYIPGKTLEKLLISSPHVEVEKAFDIIRQVAEALDYAHRNQIIHRDLKPANIILTEDGRAKITDFGIAKIAAQNAMRTMAIMGTPSYMSPEQVTGGEIDARADIFSLGILLYLMLVGEKPFLGDTAAVMFKIVYEDPVAPSKVNPKLTAADDYVVLRCLAKDRAKRYSSAREFLDDLDDLRHSRPPRSQAKVSPSEISAADRTVAAAHPLISIRPPAAEPVPPDRLTAPAPSSSSPGAPPAPPKLSAPIVSAPPVTVKPVVASAVVAPTPAIVSGARSSTGPAAPAREPDPAAPAAQPAKQKSSAAIYVALFVVVLMAVGGWFWYSHGTGNAPNPAPPPVVQTPEPAPAVPPAAAQAPANTNAVPATTNPPVQPTSITPSRTAATRQLATTPANHVPPPAPASTGTSAAPAPASQPLPAPAVPATASVADITVNCKHDYEQATLVITDGAKTIYQARLVGKKKKGFIGIGGKGFSGELKDTVAIPGSANELVVRIYTDDGAVNLQNKIAGHPPAADSNELRVTPSKDHLVLEWLQPKK